MKMCRKVINTDKLFSKTCKIQVWFILTFSCFLVLPTKTGPMLLVLSFLKLSSMDYKHYNKYAFISPEKDQIHRI